MQQFARVMKEIAKTTWLIENSRGSADSLTAFDELLEQLAKSVSRRLNRRDPVARAERRLADKASPSPSALMKGRKRRLRQKKRFEKRTEP